MSILNFQEDLNKNISQNKQKIKLLTEINEELNEKKIIQNKSKILHSEIERLELELKEVEKKVNDAWKSKIELEEEKAVKMEEERKRLLAEIEKNAHTPGYQQAMKHTNLQDVSHNKSEAPSIKSNYKKTASRLQSEIKSLKDMVNAAKLKLVGDIKDKATLETEIRELRGKLCEKKPAIQSRMTTSVPDLTKRAKTPIGSKLV